MEPAHDPIEDTPITRLATVLEEDFIPDLPQEDIGDEIMPDEPQPCKQLILINDLHYSASLMKT
jgi:hypothetical protein